MIALICVLSAIIIFGVLATTAYAAAVADIGRTFQSMTGSGLIIPAIPMATSLRTFGAEFVTTVALVTHVSFGTGISMKAQSSSAFLRLFGPMSADFFRYCGRIFSNEFCKVLKAHPSFQSLLDVYSIRES